MPEETFDDIAPSLSEREAAAAAAMRKKLRPQRPLFLRLLTPGRSDNPVWNAARKIEYLCTLPVRVPAAIVAAPFAIHNRPLQTVLGFVALFGFWELWEGFAKKPVLDIFETEQMLCMSEEFIKNDTSMGHMMACRAEALGATGRFFWKNAVVAVIKYGPGKAAWMFDQAFDDERKLLIEEESHRSVRHMLGGEIPKPLAGHSLETKTAPDVTPDPPKEDSADQR